MFEKFNEIRYLSKEIQSRELGPNHRFLSDAVSALSKEDLEELIQICIFGRDFDPADNENPADEFDLYGIVASRIVGAGSPTVYITCKPIAKYMQWAELKLASPLVTQTCLKRNPA